jgi:6-phosphogluconolactonase (cycloisomerase 2 family)
MLAASCAWIGETEPRDRTRAARRGGHLLFAKSELAAYFVDELNSPVERIDASKRGNQFNTVHIVMSNRLKADRGCTK